MTISWDLIIPGWGSWSCRYTLLWSKVEPWYSMVCLFLHLELSILVRVRSKSPLVKRVLGSVICSLQIYEGNLPVLAIWIIACPSQVPTIKVLRKGGGRVSHLPEQPYKCSTMCIVASPWSFCYKTWYEACQEHIGITHLPVWMLSTIQENELEPPF